jgi:hypothetical protein
MGAPERRSRDGQVGGGCQDCRIANDASAVRRVMGTSASHWRTMAGAWPPEGHMCQRLFSVPPTLRAGSIKMKQSRRAAQHLLP